MDLTVLTCGLYLPGCQSLKEKRRVIRSLKDRLRARFNISVAEVDNQELWQSATLAVAWVSCDGEGNDRLGDAIYRVVEQHRDVQVIKSECAKY